MTYRVEYFDVAVNSWVVSSRHKGERYAVINAEVISTSRKCAVRVIHEGLIVYAVEGK